MQLLVSFITCLTGVPGFSLRGQSYPNHGLVLIDDIGETDSNPDNRLHCVSDILCCSDVTNFRGEFFFPDTTQVPTLGGIRNGYYRNRGSDRIFLNRRLDGVVQGLFQCRIRTQSSLSSFQELYIGVYDADSGELCECVCCLCQFSMSDFIQECPWSVKYQLMGKI